MQKDNDQKLIEAIEGKGAEPLYQAGDFEVYLNPVGARELWTGTSGQDYIDNYLVVHRVNLTIESRHENIFSAYSTANKLSGMMKDNLHIYVSDPVAKQIMAAVMNGGVLAVGGDGSPAKGTVLTGNKETVN